MPARLLTRLRAQAGAAAGAGLRDSSRRNPTSTGRARVRTMGGRRRCRRCRRRAAASGQPPAGMRKGWEVGARRDVRGKSGGRRVSVRCGGGGGICALRELMGCRCRWKAEKCASAYVHAQRRLASAYADSLIHLLSRLRVGCTLSLETVINPHPPARPRPPPLLSLSRLLALAFPPAHLPLSLPRSLPRSLPLCARSATCELSSGAGGRRLKGEPAPDVVDGLRRRRRC